MLAICIENLHKHFGQRNLKVFALTSNFDWPDSRFDDVLEMVEMVERSARRVYSAGT